ncbi:MAG: thioredoxin family protein [Lishizhenia sp.]
MENNTKTWDQYIAYFNEILTAETPPAPYDNEAYMNYVTLNNSRQERWLKKGKLNEELVAKIKAIDTPQVWNVITEPWCGDASHSVPFFYLLSKENPLIDFRIVLRDTAPFMIEEYLTNGGKSIPKVVIQDNNGEDIFVWGPRPAAAQELYLSMKNADSPFEEQKIKLQQWYNKDKGQTLQEEIMFAFAELTLEK